uniref:DUF6570 domain-containing protein n=1 Tax=Amphimedon queenslandica TaxID=400682 RepID=A0A1X7T4J9_AMPQE
IDIVVVRKGEQTHKDFHVRRRVFDDALTWLIANNVYYQKIGISLDQDTLAMLPKDGNPSNLHTVQPAESQGVTASNDTSTTEEEEVYLSFVPNAAPPATQRETIEQAVQLLGQSQPSHLTWLSIGGTPINEFLAEVYFSMAFPTLVPTGAADLIGT